MNKRAIFTMMFTFILLTSSSLLFSQVNKDALFKEAKDLNKKALEMAANIFSKPDFTKAAEALTDAEGYSKDPADTEDMIGKLNLSIDSFKAAIENSKNISPNFTALLKTRQLVLNIGIDVKLIEPWEDGEDNFISAVEEYIDKDAEAVKKYSDEAEKFYKEAELIAIQRKYHGNLIAEVEKAEDADLAKYAPVTLAKVKAYAKEIEGIIAGNRYDTLKARTILNNATYELNHGLYMQRVFTNLQKDEKSFEDLQLMWEEPLAKIGALYLIPRSFDKGFDDFTNSVVDNINGDKAKLAAAVKDRDNLTANLNESKKSYDAAVLTIADNKKQNQLLTVQVDSLNKAYLELRKYADDLSIKMTAVEAEKTQFQTQVAGQTKFNELMNTVTSIFLPSEAEIIRTGDLISIRLVNINFPANKATIDPQYYNLLAKVQKAIKLFPNASVVIEGHTDGLGDFKKNNEISQLRANAVFQYLLSTMGAETKNITAVGLGGSKPVANNNTEEGRAKNRRIEIVINPNVEKAK